MKLITADALLAHVTDILMRRGITRAEAGIGAGSLVHANLRGVDSHGVMRLPHYCRALENGSLQPAPEMRVERTGPCTADLDGAHALGIVGAWRGMETAIEMARESGIGFVSISRSDHCGALSYFAYQAIDAGMIGIAMTQTDKGAIPFGGRKPFFGTNPMCFGFPSSSGMPIVLDMATSTVAGGKVYMARAENKPIPDTWAVDEDGNPTTDPHKGVYWTHMAGAKGFGLAAAVDLLTGVLAGGNFGPHIPVMYGDYAGERNLCHLSVAIDFRRFRGREAYLDQVSRMVADIHAAPPREESGKILAPGEPEILCEQTRRRDGIPIADEIYDEVMAL